MTTPKIDSKLTNRSLINTQQDTPTQKEPKKSAVSQLISNIFNSIKNWFDSTFSSILKTKVTNIVSETNENQSIAELSDLMGDIAQNAPEKLEEVHMHFDETQGELSVIFGDSDPITYKPETKKESQAFKRTGDLSTSSYSTFQELLDSYRESMGKDYNRAGSGVKIFNGNEVYDTNKQTDNIFEKLKAVDKGKRKEFIDAESQLIVDHVLEIYDSHLPGENSSRAILEGISSQAGYADVLPLILDEIAKKDTAQIFPHIEERSINIYQISQESFFLDLTLASNNRNTETEEIIPTSHRFQLLISPSSFHVVGKQHDLSNFPEQVIPIDHV
jgi:hypothetical protein